MSSARLCRSAPFVALLVLFLIAAPATAARKHHAPKKGVGSALGVMPDKTGKPVRLRAHALPTVGTTFLRSLQRKTHRPRAPRVPLANMTYHGGALVIGPHTTHVVYWQPPGFTVTAQYHTLIERFLADVAADSGRATNVYATDTQYNDSTNTFIQYQQTFGGVSTDTTAFPATVAGCPLTDGTNTVANCLTQTQEATELDNFIQANSLPRGIDHIYFLVLPDNVETCVDDFSDCGNILDTSPRYCAYHSSFNIGGHGLTLWANQPYIGFGHSPAHCNSGNATARPNGDVTDHELNVLSHEHNETITDPTGAGWFDTNGAGENGDLCNFNFGTRIANNGTGDYNQLINHNVYEIQLEWSNASSACAANYGAVAPTADFTFSPPSPHALDPVSFDGTLAHSNNSGGYLIDYQWNFGDSGTGSGPTPSHAYAAAGTYNVTLTVEDDAGLTASVVHQVVVVQRPTVTTYTGATTGDYHDTVTLSGTLDDAATAGPLAGETLSFTLGAQGCSGVTDVFGFASCDVLLNQVPGSYTVTASFTGDSVYGASSDSTPFDLTREETTLTYTGPTVILANASSLTVSATLLEDGAVPPSPSGQTVTFTLGAQSCSGTTDASGNASCTISPVSSQLGNQTVTSVFAGDAYYLPSSDSDEVVVFAFPSRGAFALGDLTAAGAGSNTVTWWSHSWSSLNSLSAGQAPSSFKGFASGVTLPQMSPPELCGTTFAAQPGNSGHPPDTVPEYMGVLVTSSVTQAGSTLNGSWGSIVVVHTDPGYGPNPGHPGTGTIVATFC
ncbi:MAG: PKD domain-containing protein [Actinobacteria bacterium]|nr:MAG: PKD domain-containing protein [Actinomycetota bacterium]